MFDYQKENNFVNYIMKLSKLKNDIVIISIKDTLGFFMTTSESEALKLLGLKEINFKDIRSDHWKGYVAVIAKQKIIFEKKGALNESVRCVTKIGDVEIDVLSAPFKNLNTASILIDNEEFSLNKRNFNIVVYNMTKKVVSDSVSFDLHSPNKVFFRDVAHTYSIVKPYSNRPLQIRSIEPVIDRLKISNIFSTNEIEAAKEQLTLCSKSNGDENEKHTEKKIKVRFFYWGWFTFWNAIESVVNEFSNDDKYDVLLIYLAADEKSVKRLNDTGLSILNSKQYDIEKDSPDIAIYNFVPGFYKTCSSVKLSVYVNLGLVIGIHEKQNPDFVLNHLCGKLQNDLDLIIVEKNLYNEVIKSKRCQKNRWYPMGNPKFDSIYKKVFSYNNLSNEWNKVKGKKVILWAFDHEWDTVSVAFDLYIKAFVEFFSNNQDMALIIRPHPNYPFELVKSGVWTEDDLKMIEIICAHSNNIIWDTSSDYGVAYRLSSGIITDINCGITISALALDKPLAVLHRFDCDNPQEPQFPDVINSLYNLFGVEDLYDFFNMVSEGDDYLKEERTIIKNKYISNFDGKNGERIKQFIEAKYKEKVGAEND